MSKKAKKTKKAKEMKPKSSEYKVKRTNYRSASNRHIVILETTMNEIEKYKVLRKTELLRQASNELTGIMLNNYNQLVRTKEYRNLKKLYGKYAKAEDKKKLKVVTDQLKALEEQYHVTKAFCTDTMKMLNKRYNVGSVFTQAKAEDIWNGIEKCLYSNGNTLHFYKKDDLPALRSKQIERCITMSVKKQDNAESIKKQDNAESIKKQDNAESVKKQDNAEPVKKQDNAEPELQFYWNGIKFGVLIKDAFDKAEVQKLLEYLTNAEEIEKKAVEEYAKTEKILDTYRPCYCTLVCKKIRNKVHVYVHITIEGLALPKMTKKGHFKHSMGTGVVGVDIGTQTVAYTSNTEVALKNIAERGSSIKKRERQERLIKRAMDRSLRANNPQYYNEDGTIKKGKKNWKYSKRYKKLLKKYRELSRKAAINRHLAINEEVNHIRSLADTCVTEPKNAKKLQKRAKTTTVNSKGKINRKKRFGKSIQNRCPGYLQEQLKKKFLSTGGNYIEVPNEYRASQYDHTNDKYTKKKLSQRMYDLSDKTTVQRDMYSSFLLYNINLADKTIDKKACKSNFASFYSKEEAVIDWIKIHRIKVMNSGIKLNAA